MRNVLRKYAAMSAIALASGWTSVAHAEEVNVAFFPRMGQSESNCQG
jgi:hypothetical protein